MVEIVEYSRSEMIAKLEKYFVTELRYSVVEYGDKWRVRVPLYFSKGKTTKKDEVVIEVVTNEKILPTEFFPTIPIEDVKQTHTHQIKDASPLRFYRYYFPWAKVYYAVADYATKLKSFKAFKEICEKYKIGLIKVCNVKSEEPEKEIEILIEPPTFTEELSNSIISLSWLMPYFSKPIQNELETHLMGLKDYLVFYSSPRYERRAITGRYDQKISLLLLNEAQELRHIEYRDDLHKFSSDYRIAEDSDYKLTCVFVKKLWEKYLGLTYPNPEIQEKFEEIFFKDYSYRGHFIHQFQVFLLGSVIIDRLYNSNSTKILSDFSQEYKVPFERAWLAAATYHDYNYSTQKYKSWYLQYLIDVMRMENKEVKKELVKLNLDFAAVRENFLRTSERIINVLCDEYVEKATRQSEEFKETLDLFLYEKIVTERNHALTSGVTLFKIYKKANKKGGKFPPEAIEQTTLAISLHDERMWEYFCGCKGCLWDLKEKTCTECRKRMKEIRKKTSKGQDRNADEDDCKLYEERIKNLEIIKTLKFEKLPLLYLLIFCDSCQDEGRGSSESEIVEAIIDKLEINPDGRVTLTLIAKNNHSFKEKFKEFNRLKQFFADGNFEVNLRLHDRTKIEKFVF